MKVKRRCMKKNKTFEICFDPLESSPINTFLTFIFV